MPIGLEAIRAGHPLGVADVEHAAGRADLGHLVPDPALLGSSK
jgi:hypothetical protein